MLFISWKRYGVSVLEPKDSASGGGRRMIATPWRLSRESSLRSGATEHSACSDRYPRLWRNAEESVAAPIRRANKRSWRIEISSREYHDDGVQAARSWVGFHAGRSTVNGDGGRSLRLHGSLSRVRAYTVWVDMWAHRARTCIRVRFSAFSAIAYSSRVYL